MLAAVWWWLVLSILGAIALPLATRVFANLPDRGAAFARALALTLTTFVGWALTVVGAPRGAAWFAALILLATVSAALLWFAPSRDRIEASEILRSEVVFAGAFALFTFARGFHPDILGLEKFMDFAIFNALLRTSSFPPEDPWLAGYFLNYYYFGHLVFAALAKLTRLAPEIAFTLSTATVAALVAAGAFSIGRYLGGRVLHGVVAASAVVLISNLHPFLRLLEGAPFGVVDFFQATRVVTNVATEFPLFPFLFGELHAHAVALVLDVTLLALVLGSRDVLVGGDPAQPAVARVLSLLIMIMVLATVMITNPWDVPVGVTVFALVTLGRWRHLDQSAKGGLRMLLFILGLVGAASLLAHPFYQHYSPPVLGIGLVRDRTAVAQFFTMFGFLLLPGLVVTLDEGRRLLRGRVRPSVSFLAAGVVLAATLWSGATVLVLNAVMALVCLTSLTLGAEDRERALSLILLGTTALVLTATELIYVKDLLLDEAYRFNTVFKLYFQAWLLLGLAFALLTRRAISVTRGRVTRIPLVVLLVIGGLASLYPFGAYFVVRVPAALDAWTLDGMAYMHRNHPGDAAAILWLRTVHGRSVLVEATAGPGLEGPYAYTTRISSNTGISTLLGWEVNELFWRGPSPLYGQRRRAIFTTYQNPDAEEVHRTLCDLGVRFVIVGELERSVFSELGMEKFTARPDLFYPSFEESGTSVFEVRSCRGRP